MVLASGGYQGNTELMARYHGPLGMLARPVARGGNYNKGEGIEMALAVGAATAGNFALFHAEPVDPRSGDPEAAIFAFTYGILVNVDGERFVDEARGPIDAWYERITRDIQAQPRGIAWMILDAEGPGDSQPAHRDPHRPCHQCAPTRWRSWPPASRSTPRRLEATVGPTTPPALRVSATPRAPTAWPPTG